MEHQIETQIGGFNIVTINNKTPCTSDTNLKKKRTYPTNSATVEAEQDTKYK